MATAKTSNRCGMRKKFGGVEVLRSSRGANIPLWSTITEDVGTEPEWCNFNCENYQVVLIAGG